MLLLIYALRSSPQMWFIYGRRNCISLKCTCRGERECSSRAACECATCNFIFYAAKQQIWATDSISLRRSVFSNIAVMPFPVHCEVLRCNCRRFLSCFLRKGRQVCLRKWKREIIDCMFLFFGEWKLNYTRRITVDNWKCRFWFPVTVLQIGNRDSSEGAIR